VRLSQIIRKLTLLKEVIISAIFLLVNFLGVCSRVHLRRLLRLRGDSLDIGDSFDRATERSNAGAGQSAGTELCLPEK